MVSSLKDIASMFQASSDTPEDEEGEILDHKAYLRQLIENGELKRLLYDKFGLDSSNQMLSTALLVANFPKLNDQQLDLIKESMVMDLAGPWSEYAPYMKQLQFYLSFGSYGPREGLPFDSTHRPLDFTFILPSQPATSSETKVHKLNRQQLVDLYTITEGRKKLFYPRGLDTGSRCVLWSAIVVAIIVTFQERQLQKESETKVNVLGHTND